MLLLGALLGGRLLRGRPAGTGEARSRRIFDAAPHFLAAGFLAAGFLADLAAGLGAGAFFGVALGLATVCRGVARERRSIGRASEDEGTASTPSSGRSHGDAVAAAALQGTRHTRLLLGRRLLGRGLLRRGLLGGLLGRRGLLLGLGALERADRLEEVDDGRHGCSVWVRRRGVACVRRRVTACLGQWAAVSVTVATRWCSVARRVPRRPRRSVKAALWLRSVSKTPAGRGGASHARFSRQTDLPRPQRTDNQFCFWFRLLRDLGGFLKAVTRVLLKRRCW